MLLKPKILQYKANGVVVHSNGFGVNTAMESVHAGKTLEQPDNLLARMESQTLIDDRHEFVFQKLLIRSETIFDCSLIVLVDMMGSHSCCDM
jgi:hypothetical protein